MKVIVLTVENVMYIIKLWVQRYMKRIQSLIEIMIGGRATGNMMEKEGQVQLGVVGQ